MKSTVHLTSGGIESNPSNQSEGKKLALSLLKNDVTTRLPSISITDSSHPQHLQLAASPKLRSIYSGLPLTTDASSDTSLSVLDTLLLSACIFSGIHFSWREYQLRRTFYFSSFRPHPVYKTFVVVSTWFFLSTFLSIDGCSFPERYISVLR